MMCFLLAVLIRSSLFPFEYYVDNGHPSASDANPGTESLPWLTILKSADMVNPGDTVFVKTGTYDERVMVTRDGTTAAKITFRAVPRRTVQVLHGFNLNADAVRLEGFDITHDAGGWLGGGVWLSGNGIEIEDNYIHNVPGAGISTNWGANGGLWNDVTVRGNHIYGCNMAISSVSGDHWLVEDNDLERLIYAVGDADFMRFFGTNGVIRRNYLHGTIESEIGASHVDFFQTYDNNGGTAQNMVFEYNVCTGFAHQAFMMEGNGSSHSDIIIRYNVIEGFTSWGVCAENVQNIQVCNNTWLGLGVDDPVSIHGVGFRFGSTGIAKNNLFAMIIAPYWHDAASSYECANNMTFGCRDNPNPGSPSDLLGVDPHFAASGSVLGPDGIPRTIDDGLQLTLGSPAINAGTDVGLTRDIRGRAMVQTPDIGAYEFGVLVSARAFLEGAYASGEMRTDLLDGGHIPLNSPYDGTAAASVPPNAVDWALIELRAEADGSGENFTKSVFVRNDGRLVDVDGSETIPFIAPENAYFIAVKHRNHLGVMSASAVPLAGP